MKVKRIVRIALSVSLFTALLGTSGTPVWARGMTVPDPQYKAQRLAVDTPLAGVNGATIGKDGNLYVTHTGNGSITKIDLATMKPSAFVPPYAGVFIVDDIAADGQGNFYATGTTPLVGQVYRIDPHGVKTVIARGMAAPNGIEFNKNNGRLFVSECFQGNRVYEVDPTGQKEARVIIDKDVIAVPEGFDFDPDTNDLIIPDMASGKILRVNPDTREIKTVAEKFVTPIALTIGADKMIYIPELATGAVYKLSLDGAKREKIAQLTPGLDNVAITPKGRLFVTSYWDATIYEIIAGGKGKFKRLFPTGPNQLLGVVAKDKDILVADAIMLRNVKGGQYHATKLNAWAAHGMPLPLSLADGPGDQVFWTDCINGAVAVGNPFSGEFKPVAGGLNLPISALMNGAGTKLYVAEYGAGQITIINLADGAKSILVNGLEGPLSMALSGDTLYVGESRIGRISAVNTETGKKDVFISSLVGKPLALGTDGSANLLVLDGAGQKILKINPTTLNVKVVAENVPVQYATVGSYPAVEFPAPMYVNKKGDIYLGTMNRGLLKLKNVGSQKQ